MNPREPAAATAADARGAAHAADAHAVYAPPPGAGRKSRLAHSALRACGWRRRFAFLPIRWVGKKALLDGWLGAVAGPVLWRRGGRPVFRHHATGMVGQLAAQVNAEPWCWLALSPEGTRAQRGGAGGRRLPGFSVP
jgi:hypothetical protein